MILSVAAGGAVLLLPSSALAAAATVRVTLDPASIVANGTSTSTVTATVTDGQGHPVSGDTVVIASSFSGSSDAAGPTIGPVMDHGDGTYTATITSSTRLGSATITATDTSVTPNLSGSATLRQTAGPAASVAVTAIPSSIIADGRSTSTATATVVDAQGHPVSGDTVLFTSSFSGSSGGSGPTIGPVTNHHNGTYTATITSSTTPGSATITATDTSVTPNLSGSATLRQTAGPAASVAVTAIPSSIIADGRSTSTATATVVDAQGHPVSGDTVLFTSSFSGSSGGSGPTIGPVTNHGDGTYTATITSSTTPGLATITATDTTASVSSSATLTQTVVPVTTNPATRLTVGTIPTSIVADGRSTSTVTATVTDARGQPVNGDAVVFRSSDPGERIGPVANLGGGTYTATITSSTTLGSATITATDTSVSPNLVSRATLAQTANGSTTSLLVVPVSPVTNQNVTLIAVVTSSTTAASPSGTVSFDVGDAPIGGCQSVPVSGFSQSVSVMCQTSFAAAISPAQLRAVFSGSAGSTVAGSVSATYNLRVAADATLTSLDVSNPTVNVRANVTYTATVTPAHSGPVKPSGLIEFLDGGKPIRACLAQSLESGVGGSVTAKCKVSYGQPGSHLITARYGGDPNFAGSRFSSGQSVRIRKLSPRVLGTITSTMQWTFFYTPTYTKVLTLAVNGPPPGATVIMACRGRGCPALPPRTTTPVKSKRCTSHRSSRCPAVHPASINLGRFFSQRRLQAGARITIAIVRTGWIGKHYLFTMRAAQGPRIKIACLAPGTINPGRGC